MNLVKRRDQSMLFRHFLVQRGHIGQGRLVPQNDETTPDCITLSQSLCSGESAERTGYVPDVTYVASIHPTPFGSPRRVADRRAD